MLRLRNGTLARTKTTVTPTAKIIQTIAKKGELGQYKMKDETNLSYRTILRTLKPLEQDGYITLLRTEPSKKGGKEKKIYSLTFKGLLVYLSSLAPQAENNSESFFQAEIKELTTKIQPLSLETLAKIMHTAGNQFGYPVFKQIFWLRDNCGPEIFLSIVYSANNTVASHRSFRKNWGSDIRKMAIANCASRKEAEKMIGEILASDDSINRKSFAKEFAPKLWDLLNENQENQNPNRELYKTFSQILKELKQDHKNTILPIKSLVKALKP